MASYKVEATCSCGWTGPLDDLDLAHFDLVCPECDADDWRVNVMSGEIAMQVMSKAFRTIVELTEGVDNDCDARAG